MRERKQQRTGRRLLRLCLILASLFSSYVAAAQSPASAPPARSAYEYVWYEAEDMRGFSTNERFEPGLNPWWVNPPKSKAPGWGINGPGVSAEWTQGGE